VGEVVFEGRPKLPASALKGALSENQEHNLISWISGKDVFKQNKLTDEVDEDKKRLQENGYMEATVGEPRTEEMERGTVFL